MSEIRVKRKHPGAHDAPRFEFGHKPAPEATKTGAEAEVVVRKLPTTTEGMIDSIKTILSQQIERIRLSSHSRALTTEEVNALRDYTRNLIELNKDEREMIKAESANLDNIDTQALIERLRALDTK